MAGLRTKGMTTFPYIITTGDDAILYENTLWDDFRVSLEKGQLAGGSNPAYEAFKTNGSGSKGVYAYNFSDGNEIFFSLQMPHKWKEGTTIYPHIHIAPKTDGTGNNSKFQLEYAWKSINDTFGNTTIIDSGNVALETAFKHKYQNIGSGIVATGQTISSMLLCRLSRIAASANNFTGGIYIFEFDIHYEIDRPGSRSEVTK